MTQMSDNRLSSVFSPGVFTCQHVEGNGESSVRLKRFGICSGREIEVVQAGDPMVLSVLDTRVGLSRELGQLVVLDSDAANAECGSL